MSLAECQKRCVHESGCFAIDYDIDGSSCRTVEAYDVDYIDEGKEEEDAYLSPDNFLDNDGKRYIHYRLHKCSMVTSGCNLFQFEKNILNKSYLYY